MGRSVPHLVILSLVFALAGCSFFGSLDQIHEKEPPFDVHFTWDRGPDIGPPATTGEDGKKYDKDGNLIPTPETKATYSFPPVTAGLDATVWDKYKVTPTIGIALIDLKVPYARWFDVQVFGGYQQAGIGLYKRFTSIIEICAGVGVVWDFDLRKPLPVVGFTITRF